MVNSRCWWGAQAPWDAEGDSKRQMLQWGGPSRQSLPSTPAPGLTCYLSVSPEVPGEAVWLGCHFLWSFSSKQAASCLYWAQPA